MPDIKTVRRINFVPISKIEKYEFNPKIHSVEQIDSIAASIVEFGFNVPIQLIDIGADKYRLVAGEGRYLAARVLGMDELPAIFLNHLNIIQGNAYLLADNATARGGNDQEKLKKVFEFLEKEKFDLTLTGFDEAEINRVLKTIEIKVEEKPAAPAAEKKSKPAKTVKEIFISIDDFLIPVSDLSDIKNLETFCKKINSDSELKEQAAEKIKSKVLAIVADVLFKEK